MASNRETLHRLTCLFNSTSITQQQQRYQSRTHSLVHLYSPSISVNTGKFDVNASYDVKPSTLLFPQHINMQISPSVRQLPLSNKAGQYGTSSAHKEKNIVGRAQKPQMPMNGPLTMRSPTRDPFKSEVTIGTIKNCR